MKHLDRLTIDVRRNDKGEPLAILSFRWAFGLSKHKTRGFSLYLAGSEIKDALTTRGCMTITDLNPLSIFGGDLWTYANVQSALPAGHIAGRVDVEVFRLEMPRLARLRLLSEIQIALGAYDLRANGGYTPDERLTYSQTELERLTSRFGRGTGQVELVFSTDETAARYQASLGSESFDQCIERLENIARNGTEQSTDVETVHLRTDGAKSFTFSAGGLYGGLINHGTPESPDWSLHT